VDSVKQTDLALWDTWNSQGRKPEDVRPLLKQFTPMIQSRVTVYGTANKYIPPAALEAELKRLALGAFETYNPKSGAALSTHVFNHLKGVSRFVGEHQNIARIPETRLFDIGKLQRAKAVLDIEYDRTPTQHELARYLKWPLGTVKRLQKELRKDLSSNVWAEDITSVSPSKTKMVASIAPKILDNRELRLYNYLRQDYTPKQISIKMKISQPTISRIRKNIGKKLGNYL